MPPKAVQVFRAPSAYEEEMLRAKRQQQLAEMLRQQAFAPEEEPFTFQGFRAMPSAAGALSKMLQAYGAKKIGEKAEESERRAREADIAGAEELRRELAPQARVAAPTTAEIAGGIGMPQISEAGTVSYGPSVQAPTRTEMVGPTATERRNIFANYAVTGTPTAQRLAQVMAGMETPEEAEYGTTPQYDKQGRAFVVNKAGNVRYLQGVEAPAAAPAAVTPTTIVKNGRKIVVDARTGAEIGAAPSDALPQGPKETAEGLRKEFTGQTAQYRGIVDAFQKIKTAAMNPSAANDISLIFGFMKALDPTSTVREGEAATAENARGVSEDIRNLYNKVNTGQRLSQAQRQDFLQSAYGLVESQIPNAQEIIDRYSGIANRAGLNAQDVISDPFKNVRIVRLKSGNDPAYSALKSGDLYFSPDGVMRRKK